MKKIIAMVISLIMVFSAVPMAMVSAETDYDYYSVFSADTDELPILFYPGGHANYEIVDDTVRNDGGKIVKVTKIGMYSQEPNIAFKQDFSKIADKSIGIRVFIAKSENASSGKLVTLGFGSSSVGETYIDTDMWGTPNGGNVTTEGSWYEIYWSTAKLLKTTVTDLSADNNGYKINSPNWQNPVAGTVDADFISGMDSIYIKYNLGTSEGHYSPNHYFFDDVQFIYEKGNAPSEEPETPTTTAVSTVAEASIRLGDVNGIRFYTTVDEEALAELVGTSDYEIGTIIAPADLIGDDGELTADDDCQIIPFKARTSDGNIEYFNAENKEIAGSLVAIKDGNIARDFAARAYVKVGETYYYSATTATRSLRTVALALQADTSAEGQALYEANKDLVDGWASAADWSAQ